jgi:hypothetical protein
MSIAAQAAAISIELLLAALPRLSRPLITLDNLQMLP